jgi:Na+-transporting NADH:ubiquinone oxidoreductase subunit B
MAFIDFWKRIEPDKKKAPFLHTAYDAFFTFFFKPNTVTQGKTTHIKDAMDLKRTMVHVVIAMQLCYVFGAFNIGHQHFLALGTHTGILDGLHLKLVYGIMQILPLFIVSNAVGLGIEFYFAAKKGHAVEEGYLVTGALIPAIMPPDVPLWMVALATAFAVILGKEAFGGTGMNILNVALLARAFIFFAYPTEISGDEPWIGGFDKIKEMVNGKEEEVMRASYSFYHTMFNPIFRMFGISEFVPHLQMVQGYSGATPLGIAPLEGWAQYDPITKELVGGVTATYSPLQMFIGGIPGCIGETCKPAIIFGAVFLAVTGVASWRIMVSMALGVALTGMLFNVWGFNAYMEIPWHQHFWMGGLLFALAFMATDPVTACGTNTGKWIYGFLIGFFGLVIRVMNPAYAEGWMLAILLLNVFAPLIDYTVVQSHISKRLKRKQQHVTAK